MKVTRFATFAPYKDFVRACTDYPKVDMRSEQNNMYGDLGAGLTRLKPRGILPYDTSGSSGLLPS